MKYQQDLEKHLSQETKKDIKTKKLQTIRIFTSFMTISWTLQFLKNMDTSRYTVWGDWVVLFHLVCQIAMFVLTYMSFKVKIEYTLWLLFLQQIRLYAKFIYDEPFLNSDMTKGEQLTNIMWLFFVLCLCYLAVELYRLYD